MSTETLTSVRSDEMECASFYLDDLLVGVDIQQIQEINRHLDMTPVPQSPECVSGVVNLRGEVVTVVDLRSILGMDKTEISDDSRNVVVNSRDEQIGLLVDRIADVVKARDEEIEPPPANVSGVDGRYFKGVCKLESELLVILDVDEVLAAEIV